MTEGTNGVAVLTMVLLVAFGGVAGVAGTAGADTGTAASTTLPPTDGYVLEQGGECYPIEALSTSGTVESFYDYRNHETHPEGVDRMYSSYGTEHLQENNASILFLHEGTDGVSLVMVHDRVDGGSTGGVATFDIVGLPHEAEWEVENDNYTGDTNMDEFDTGDGWADASWIWVEDRTGGGAIQGGLEDPFAVTVHPAFNEDAEYYENDDLYDPDWYDGGEIDDWVVLSGDADNPERTTLDSLEESVTIRTGTCDDPSVSYDYAGDGIMASITDAAPDDRIALQPTSGTGEGVTFDSVTVTGIDGEGEIGFENRADELPAQPSDVASLSQLSVTGDSSGETSATVTVSVDATTLDEHQLAPDEIALYAADGGEWSQAETTLTDQSATEYRYSAEVDTLEGLLVAEQRHESVPGESGSSSGTESGSDSSANENASGDDDASSMPGFGTGAAVGTVLLLIALLATRGRDR